MNPILHVPGMLGNQGRLDAGEPFQFYGTGITRTIARVIDALDAERVALARAFEVAVPTVRGWLARTYGLEGDFAREGRTLERMGLEGRSLDATRSAVNAT